MDLAFLQPLYETHGPIASLYINTSRDTETAESKIWIRWEQARRELAAQGMDEETLGAMDEVVGDTEGVSGVHGQVVYAAGGEVLFDSTVSEPPQDYVARGGPLPDPLPYMVAEGRHIPHVLAVVDSIGADLRAEYADGRTVNRRVEGADKPVHKVREGGYHHGHMQRAVDEQVRQNVDQVVDEVTALADRSRAEVVALSGEAQVRGELMERLPERVRERVVVLEAGSRAPGSDSSPLDEELSALLDREAAEHIEQAVSVYERERSGGAVTDGFADTVRALQRGQVDTLLWTDTLQGADRDLWIGPSGEQIFLSEQTLHDMGIDGSSREKAGPALARAVATTGAELVFVPENEARFEEGIGAVLRYANE